MSAGTKSFKKRPPPRAPLDVLTLSEAADYLRVSDGEVLEMATRGDLPGRKIGAEWRFLKQALADWLAAPSPRQRLMRHAGEARDDPYMDEMLEMIYRERGRPMIDDGE